ncbi:MAG: hypothetical protein LH613_13905 [Chamaesiphon sp.]|nr:hypothetical protein [Chamaesiphon sp.]
MPIAIGEIVRDRNEAIEWAQKVLQEPDKYLILDPETTGLFDAELDQIGTYRVKSDLISAIYAAISGSVK